MKERCTEMIIKISQTASNVRQSYDIAGKNFNYQGKAGSVSRLQNVVLANSHTTIRGVYYPSRWVNYIPFRYLFGKENLTRRFRLYRNESSYGSIAFSKHGWMKSFYVISLNSGETFHCYCCAKGTFRYVSIYQEKKQIAVLETYLCVSDDKYSHKLYILDEYDQYAEALSFFAVYYASLTFSKRFHMSRGSVSQRAWSLSRYNDKYDPTWREKNFPDEDFFGKINLF